MWDFAFPWWIARRVAAAAVVLWLVAASIVIVPSGAAAVRVSRLSGAVKGPTYAGTHFVVPLAQTLEVYSIRDQVYTTIPSEIAKDPNSVLKVHSREGLPVGLGVTVRYQLDPQRLAYIQSSLPRPVECRMDRPSRRLHRRPRASEPLWR